MRQHLDRFGTDRRGTIARPDLHSEGILAIESLLGGRLGKRLDLTAVETALSALGVGEDLDRALTVLGHPPSDEAAKRRADRARSAAARAALRDGAASWPEPWACGWAEEIISAGLIADLDRDEIVSLADDVRRLLDTLRLDERRPDVSCVGRGDDSSLSGQPKRCLSSPTGRTELAAALFGSAHALDPGTKRAAVVARALRCRLDTSLDGRELWEAAGIGVDRVSAPALAWAVPAEGESALAEMLRRATAGGLPVHVSLFALQTHAVTVPAGTSVLVVENPRLVEAAAERGLGCCVVAGNGNPAAAVIALLTQMLDSGAELLYHGDFDAAGISICRRMHALGCRPWRMGAGDYCDAVRTAAEGEVSLERDSKECGPTPWDLELEAAFNNKRLIVHEEFVLDSVLGVSAALTATSPR